MGIFAEDRYEAEFVITKSPDETWQSLQEENEREPRFLTAFPGLPEFEVTAEIIVSEPLRLIRARKTSEPCAGTEITITLSPSGTGTHVRVVQSDFPAWAADAPDIVQLGGDQIVCDLVLYLDRGIEISRHSMPWAFSGLMVEEVATGLEISSVMPGSFGERAGLHAGDLLLALAGAPVFTQREMQALLRILKPGDEIEVTYVRNNSLDHASAEL